jgi:hypothetical protein
MISRKKPENFEKILLHCHFVHHKYHLTWEFTEVVLSVCSNLFRPVFPLGFPGTLGFHITSSGVPREIVEYIENIADLYIKFS